MLGKIVILFSSVAFCFSCSFDISKTHRYVLAESSSGPRREEIVLEILEEGKQFLVVVDGDTRRTHFVAGKYFLVTPENSISLDFLTAERPSDLWDNFVKIDGKWIAIDISSSKEKISNAMIEMVTFEGNCVTEKKNVFLDGLECSFEDVAIGRSGKYMLLKHRLSGIFLLDFDQELPVLSEVDEKEFAERRDSTIDLTNKGIFLDMGSYGVFGKWCQ